jgi:hypothetical protein
VDDSFSKWSTLRDQTEKALLDFIRTDLEVCLTFAVIVETEYGMGNRDHAERTLAEAEKGYSTLLRLISKAKGLRVEIQNELHTSLKQLRERLDRLSGPAVRLRRSFSPSA